MQIEWLPTYVTMPLQNALDEMQQQSHTSPTEPLLHKLVIRFNELARPPSEV